MTHLSLFTGIGGIDLAAEAAGFKTVGQCEWKEFQTRVLEKHWPDVPRWRDIKTLTAEDFYARTKFRTVDLISGGFPCQPFSTAGKRSGQTDDRYLWPEMLRVIAALRPTWVLGENVAGFVGMGLDEVSNDLASAGYKARAFIIPACAIGAEHKRDRVFIVAYANGRRFKTTISEYDSIKELYEKSEIQKASKLFTAKGIYGLRDSTDIRRGARVPHWLDRIAGLGNAVVPAQVYPILKAIALLIKEYS